MRFVSPTQSTSARPPTRTAAAFVGVLATASLATSSPALDAQDANPALPQTLSTIRAQIEHGDLPAAEAALRRNLAAQPASSADPHLLLGYVLFRQRRPAESLAEYTVAARLREPSPADLTVVASDYVLLNDYTDAERWLLRATSQAPTDAHLWYLLGRTRYNEDHPAAAVEAFTQCLKLHPDDARAEYNLGLAYEHLDQPEKAVAAYRTAIAWQQSSGIRDPQPYLDLGKLLLAQRHPEQALDPLEKAAQAGPDNALAQQELGVAYEALGRYAEAVSPLRRAASLAPTAEQPHFILGRVLRHLGRTEEAKSEFAAVSRLAGSRSSTETPNSDQKP